jgi:hypothetical protein
MGEPPLFAGVLQAARPPLPRGQAKFGSPHRAPALEGALEGVTLAASSNPAPQAGPWRFVFGLVPAAAGGQTSWAGG